MSTCSMLACHVSDTWRLSINMQRLVLEKKKEKPPWLKELELPGGCVDKCKRRKSSNAQVAGFVLLVIGQMIYGEMLKAGAKSFLSSWVQDPWAVLSAQGGGAGHKHKPRFEHIMLCYVMLYCIVLYCIVLYCINCIVLIVLYCIVLYCIVLLYCIIVLYCIVLYCIVLYCIVLYCIVLYCIVLYYIRLYFVM